ncbi:MAG: hypothetical protein J3K34DRAFT_2537 [Monoraphidium minutum]|nr:MAG: hypothetical protein J3K34DRAFT_2537 [Monoraphidium minutum]
MHHPGAPCATAAAGRHHVKKGGVHPSRPGARQAPPQPTGVAAAAGCDSLTARIAHHADSFVLQRPAGVDRGSTVASADGRTQLQGGGARTCLDRCGAAPRGAAISSSAAPGGRAAGKRAKGAARAHQIVEGNRHALRLRWRPRCKGTERCATAFGVASLVVIGGVFSGGGACAWRRPSPARIGSGIHWMCLAWSCLQGRAEAAAEAAARTAAGRGASGAKRRSRQGRRLQRAEKHGLRPSKDIA